MTYFITGGTGFLGSSIILDLLDHTTDKIYCLVRSKKNQSAQNRLFDRLQELIEAYEYDAKLFQRAKEQCVVIEGALEANIMSISEHVNDTIDQFIHSAASLNYEERFRNEIFRTNLDGTKWALDLSMELKSKCFNYISTAYVVGNRSGNMLEELVSIDKCNNVYESSKLAAEKMVVASDVNYRIFRPGIIIGHSRTFYTFNYTGLYGFIRKLVQFKGVMNRIQKGYLDQNAIKMLAESEAIINFVPVDMVSNHIIKALLNNSSYKFHHLTNPIAPTMDVLGKYIFESLGLKKAIFERTDDNFNWIDKKFNEKIEFYRPQFFGIKYFDRTCINSTIGESTFEEYAVSTENLKKYIEWYINFLSKSRKSLPSTR